MIDLRLYRYALLAVPVVAAISMFSLQDVPRSVSAGIPPDAFDPASAIPLAGHTGVTCAAKNASDSPSFAAARYAAAVPSVRATSRARPGDGRMGIS